MEGARPSKWFWLAAAIGLPAVLPLLTVGVLAVPVAGENLTNPLGVVLIGLLLLSVSGLLLHRLTPRTAPPGSRLGWSIFGLIVVAVLSAAFAYLELVGFLSWACAGVERCLD